MEIKTFIWDEVENLDKLSSHTYDSEVLDMINKLSKSKNKVILNDITEKIISGPMGFQLHTTDYVEETHPDSVKLLQISNINEFGELINTNRDKYISKEKNNELKKSIVKKNDILIAKTGAIDRSALVKEEINANLNQALGIIRLKKEYNGIKIIPEFIHLFLNGYYGLKQLMRLGGYRSGQAGLSLDEITSIFILLPNETEQKKILEIIHKKLQNANNHYQNYLRYSEESKNIPIKLLNIKIPSENQRTFIFTNDIKDRIDAINNSPFLNQLKQEIKKKKYKNINGLLTDAKNKFEYDEMYNLIDLDDIDENLTEIKSFKEVPVLNSQKTTFKAGNLLISKLGSERGKVILIDKKHDGFVGSGELVGFELKDDCPVTLSYIFYLLRSPYLTKQIEYSLSGCSRMRVSKKDMKHLLIPLPNNESEEELIITKVEELIKMAKDSYNLYVEENKNAKEEYDNLLSKFL